MQTMERVDDYQRDHKWAGVSVATGRKFVEDQSTNLASMVAFWGFFSIFPLFLVFVTLLGWFLPEDMKQDVLQNVANLFPLIDPQTVGQLDGSIWALAVGLVTAVWSGSRVVQVMQFGLNSVWEVPYVDRPKLGEKLGRSVVALVAIGGGLVLAVLASGLLTGSTEGVGIAWWARILGFAVTLAVDVGLFVAAFRILTDRDVSTRDVLPGAVLSGVAFFVLQQVSTLIISRYLQNAQATYGNFATVITILWWFYLQAIITFAGAQLNVVLKDRLWPRSLGDGPETDADRRALESYAQERTYEERERVDVTVPGTPPAGEGNGHRR